MIHRIKNEPAKQIQSADIPQSSAYPQTQEYRAPGEKVTLSCKAPAGSTVTVELNGKTYKMTAGKASGSNGLYAATYTYAYTIPAYTGTPRVIDLGAPVYKMSYKGTTKTRKAPASIGVIMDGAPYYAVVKGESAYTYRSANTDGGGYHELHEGMADSVTGLTGSFARLSNGQYILKSSVNITSEITAPVIESAEYLPGDQWDTLRLKTTGLPAAYNNSDSKAVKIHVSASSKAGTPALPESSLFSAVSAAGKQNSTLYTLTLKDSRQLEGFILEKTEQGLEIRFKHRVHAAKGDTPLTGITIMVDPGHGGAETALSARGLEMAEKGLIWTMVRLKAELKRWAQPF